LAVFSIDSQSGALRHVQTITTEGKVPRNFGISPDGQWVVVANQDSHTLVSFRRDPSTGTLQPTGMTLQCPSPALICFLPGR
jgi:6-phosphogluconolactonase